MMPMLRSAPSAWVTTTLREHLDSGEENGRNAGDSSAFGIDCRWFDMRGWRSGRLELEPVRANIPMRRTVNGRIVALEGSQGNHKLSGRAAMSAIAQMEVAIRGALRGEATPRAVLG
jgi:hypothetical protein